MLPEDRDTIAAISTAPGVGAIGMVRLSGPDAIGVADRIFIGSRRPSEMSHSTVQFGKVAFNGAVLDEVMLTVLRSPSSYTGEDLVEIGCHGSPLVLRDVLSAAIAAGARLATGGEFTRRSFLHGKMDLCQAEAVMKLLSAETEEAKRVALSQVQGRTSDVISRLRGNIIRAKAELDASIDFPEEASDEADMNYDGEAHQLQEPHDSSKSSATASASLTELLSETARRLEAMITAFARSQQLQKLPTVAIIGKTNVGKSSILNSLLSEERVITSESPGTTRDRIDADVALTSGRRVRFSDTAGVLVPGVLVQRDELDGKARSKMEQAAAGSDVRLLVFDASSPLGDEDMELVEKWGPRPAVIVMNKIDLGQRWAPDQLQAFLDVRTTPTVRTCAISGLGIEELSAALDRLLETLQPQDFISGSPAEACVVGTVRNEGLLRKARDAIVSAISALCDFRLSKSEAWPEFASRDLDEALEAFSELLGIEVEVNILDEIFSRFCIGK